MQQQINKQKEESTSKAKTIEELREEFKNKTSARRVVKLKYNACCGCGCELIDIERKVAEDSDLQDGDIVSEALPDDVML